MSLTNAAVATIIGLAVTSFGVGFAIGKAIAEYNLQRREYDRPPQKILPVVRDPDPDRDMYSYSDTEMDTKTNPDTDAGSDIPDQDE
jgi:hypothetical protein